MAETQADMQRIKAPSNLPELVRTAFAKAKASGDITHYPTQVALLQVRSTTFQLRFSPALAHKPRSRSPSRDRTKKPPDPFEKPSPAVLIARLSDPAAASAGDQDGHNLVLNKFAVSPEHFILATVAFKQQTHLLEPRDLEATYACLEAYGEHSASKDSTEGDDSEGLFAFFNSGPHSGASQPHRHVQLLPVACMRDGMLPGAGWELLAHRLIDASGGPAGAVSGPPFAVFAERLPERETLSGRDLHEVYLRLYRLACAAAGVDAAVGSSGGGQEARISYNMAMTLDGMVLCPRAAEGAAVTDADGGDTVGRIELNGTVLSGAALVKNEAEWHALRKDPAQLLRVLSEIGFPPAEGTG